MRFILLFSAMLAFASASGAEEAPLYVQSTKAKLMSEPAFGAAVITELERGAAVDLLERNKRWFKVRAGQHSGWVSRFLLSDHPPLKKITVLGDTQQKDIEENARRRASAVTTAGAARGLTAEQRRRADADDDADYHALEQVEDYRVEPAEVARFAREGQLQ